MSCPLLVRNMSFGQKSGKPKLLLRRYREIMAKSRHTHTTGHSSDFSSVYIFVFIFFPLCSLHTHAQPAERVGIHLTLFSDEKKESFFFFFCERERERKAKREREERDSLFEKESMRVYSYSFVK